jgi:hypothetical protein
VVVVVVGGGWVVVVVAATVVVVAGGSVVVVGATVVVVVCAIVVAVVGGRVEDEVGIAMVVSDSGTSPGVPPDEPTPLSESSKVVRAGPVVVVTTSEDGTAGLSADCVVAPAGEPSCPPIARAAPARVVRTMTMTSAVVARVLNSILPPGYGSRIVTMRVFLERTKRWSGEPGVSNSRQFRRLVGCAIVIPS